MGGAIEREGDGVRAAAEHRARQQAGTQWPHFHTGWQSLQDKEEQKEKDGDPPCWTQ